MSITRLIEQLHDVSAIGHGESVTRFCSYCEQQHVFTMIVAMPGMKVGQADCPKAPTGKHAQLLAVDFRPNHGRQHDLRGLELGASVDRHCDKCRTEHPLTVVDLAPGHEAGSADCGGEIWTQPIAIDYPPPRDDAPGDQDAPLD